MNFNMTLFQDFRSDQVDSFRLENKLDFHTESFEFIRGDQVQLQIEDYLGWCHELGDHSW